MIRPFYAFACRHFFHKDCLESELKSHWTLQEQEKYSCLVEREKILEKQLEKSKSSNWAQKKINEIRRFLNNNRASRVIEFQEELEHIRNEINDTIAGDCIFCGIVMINSIDKPFFEEDEYEKEIATW
uniref:Uncharacterized protein n=1 Tax=Wuchereria bancrofti TaxID=6293 RepID=A0A1I8EK97_WUCBA